MSVSTFTLLYFERGALCWTPLIISERRDMLVAVAATLATFGYSTQVCACVDGQGPDGQTIDVIGADLSFPADEDDIGHPALDDPNR